MSEGVIRGVETWGVRGGSWKRCQRGVSGEELGTMFSERERENGVLEGRWREKNIVRTSQSYQISRSHKYNYISSSRNYKKFKNLFEGLTMNFFWDWNFEF